MRVVWSVPAPTGGPGSGRGTLARASGLVEGLRVAGHEVAVVEAVGGNGDGPGGYRGALRFLLPERLALAMRDGRARAHARRVAGAARERGAEVIVETAAHEASSGAWAAGLTGLPLVLDDVSLPAGDPTPGDGLPAHQGDSDHRKVETARALVASSAALRDRLLSLGLPPDRLAVVPHGVDPAAHRAADRDEARRFLGVEDRLVVGFVGSFQPWHRVDLLVEAAAAVGGDVPVHLLLVGDGPGREEALARARRLGLEERLTAPGSVGPDRAAELLAACDVGALPGTNDYDQPMNLLDYAAAGLAVVAPDRPPVREVVTDGRTALLFPPGDGEALAAHLRRLAGEPDLWLEIGEQARREVAGPASWARRAEILAAVLRDARYRSARWSPGEARQAADHHVCGGSIPPPGLCIVS